MKYLLHKGLILALISFFALSAYSQDEVIPKRQFAAPKNLVDTFAVKQRCSSPTSPLSEDEKKLHNTFEERIAKWQSQHPVPVKGKKAASPSPSITIPVVVHVIYNKNSENITNAQVWSQINALNEDWRLKNADSLPVGHPFYLNTCDTQIEFCLASLDPNGEQTTGITRTYSDSSKFNYRLDNMKKSNTGGHFGWDPQYYLNIWVCNLGDKALGRSSWPEDLPTGASWRDGVIIETTAFGYIGTAATPPYNYGRTAAHEIGHWLGLKHIWGDDTYGVKNGQCDLGECDGDDYVLDTPDACEESQGIPEFPHNPYNACGTDENGEMFMNYMDYSYDAAMVMFTQGQVNRMWATLQTYRFMLINSSGCDNYIANAESEFDSDDVLSVYPNPSSNIVKIQTPSLLPINSTLISDMLGNVIYEDNLKQSDSFTFDFTGFKPGTYFILCDTEIRNYVQKVLIVNQ
jgi:hypothetical protein